MDKNIKNRQEMITIIGVLLGGSLAGFALKQALTYLCYTLFGVQNSLWQAVFAGVLLLSVLYLLLISNVRDEVAHFFLGTIFFMVEQMINVVDAGILGDIIATVIAGLWIVWIVEIREKREPRG